MLNEIHDLPDGVIGFEVTGKLDASDYRDTLAPALQKAAAEEGGIRIVIVIPSFDGITPSAVWEDTKIGIQNWGAWKRAAVVTDADWMAHAVKWFGWLSPGELKHFATADRQAAIDWAAG